MTLYLKSFLHSCTFKNMMCYITHKMKLKTHLINLLFIRMPVKFTNKAYLRVNLDGHCFLNEKYVT